MNIRQILPIILFITPLISLNSQSYRIRGIAVDSVGILLENKRAVLKDSTGKVVYHTNTSKKVLKRYGGGKFVFDNVKAGDYDLRIETGAPLKISRKIHISNEHLDLGQLRPRMELPQYVLPDFSDSLLIFIDSISTDLIPGDSINIKHILVDLDGNTSIGRVDSISNDSLYFQSLDIDSTCCLKLDNLYFAYNDYGFLIYKSRSFKSRLKELGKRDGYLITHKQDTLHYDSIEFEEEMNNPGLAIYNSEHSPLFLSLFDIYLIRTGEGYIENSVQRGFWTGVGLIGGYLGYRMINEKSFRPALSVLPYPFVNPSGKQYQSMILTLPLLTLSWVTYDFYNDKRTNYILPQHQKSPFPKNMFVFSLSEWTMEKLNPVISPIADSFLFNYFKIKKK